MIRPVVMAVLVAACFAAAILNLTIESRARSRVMGFAILCAVGVGIVYYGTGYAYQSGLSPAVLLRSLLSLCRMFGGINDLSGISDLPLVRHPAGLTVFWLGHFCAFYVTASAAILTLGERLLRHIRVKLLRRGPLLVIFGVNASSVAYGKSQIRRKKRSVLFVDPDGNSTFDNTVKAFGAVTEKSGEALHPGKRFLKQINMKPGTRRLELAALHTDGEKNLLYARALLEALENAGISPKQTCLLISGVGEESSSLQARDGGSGASAFAQGGGNGSGAPGALSGGYGSVLAFDDYELTARVIMKEHPPCERIRFDETGRAAEDFHAVLLGYGRMGRAMLSHLLCNAQFAGSTFRADVFDPGPQNGFLHSHGVMRNYDIRFHAANGKSDEFYSFLEKDGRSVKCIVICTGSAAENREIFEDLTGWFGPGRPIPMILEASRGRYACIDEDRRASSCLNLYESDVLEIERIDAMAMQIHHMYCRDSGRTAAEDWEACGYFNRQSSRASADFYPAVLRASGKTAEEILAGDWPPPADVLENLAVTEHLRWCAFHLVMGYSPMPREVWDARAGRWLAAAKTADNGRPGFSIGKDAELRLHACLVPWEDLDELSARETAVTGKAVDYKEMDRRNILAAADVLKAVRAAEEEGKNG